jgi:hypothetical protein
VYLWICKGRENSSVYAAEIYWKNEDVVLMFRIPLFLFCFL